MNDTNEMLIKLHNRIDEVGEVHNKLVERIAVSLMRQDKHNKKTGLAFLLTAAGFFAVRKHFKEQDEKIKTLNARIEKLKG